MCNRIKVGRMVLSHFFWKSKGITDDRVVLIAEPKNNYKAKKDE